MKIYKKSLSELKNIVQTKTRQLNDPQISKSVSEIIENVIENGDQAVKEYEKKFDNVDI